MSVKWDWSFKTEYILKQLVKINIGFEFISEQGN